MKSESFDQTTPRNAWQKVADATNNIVTPANAIDAVGFVGALYAIPKLDTPAGIAIAAASYMTDFVDGPVARATGTASELGEKVDAVGDKLKLAYAVPQLWKLGVVPKPLLAAITAQNGANAALTLIDRSVNDEPVLHSSKDGKRAYFLQEWAIGLHVIGSEVRKQRPVAGQTLKAAGTIIGLAGLGYGVRATKGYKETLTSNQKAE